MSDTKDQHEPSMEEILASIRRIIAEDNDSPDAKNAPAPEASPPLAIVPEDDVLELTEVIEEDRAVTASPEPAPPTDRHDDEPVFSMDPEPHATSAAAADEERERLLSNTTAAASIAALSQLVSRGQRDRSGELPLGAVNRTLEDMVLELMRPMLKTWLDENLPSLVERLVQDEIARLVRDAQGR